MPHNNVWKFDVGKPFVPRVFVDVDLLMDMAKRYDPITRAVNNYVGERLFAITTPVIREDFMCSRKIMMHG